MMRFGMLLLFFSPPLFGGSPCDVWYRYAKFGQAFSLETQQLRKIEAALEVIYETKEFRSVTLDDLLRDIEKLSAFPPQATLMQRMARYIRERPQRWKDGWIDSSLIKLVSPSARDRGTRHIEERAEMIRQLETFFKTEGFEKKNSLRDKVIDLMSRHPERVDPEATLITANFLSTLPLLRRILGQKLTDAFTQLEAQSPGFYREHAAFQNFLKVASDLSTLAFVALFAADNIPRFLQILRLQEILEVDPEEVRRYQEKVPLNDRVRDAVARSRASYESYLGRPLDPEHNPRDREWLERTTQDAREALESP